MPRPSPLPPPPSPGQTGRGPRPCRTLYRVGRAVGGRVGGGGGDLHRDVHQCGRGTRRGKCRRGGGGWRTNRTQTKPRASLTSMGLDVQNPETCRVDRYCLCQGTSKVASPEEPPRACQVAEGDVITFGGGSSDCRYVLERRGRARGGAGEADDGLAAWRRQREQQRREAIARIERLARGEPGVPELQAPPPSLPPVLTGHASSLLPY